MSKIHKSPKFAKCSLKCVFRVHACVLVLATHIINLFFEGSMLWCLCLWVSCDLECKCVFVHDLSKCQNWPKF